MGLRLITEHSWHEESAKVWIIEEGTNLVVLQFNEGTLDGKYIPADVTDQDIEPTFKVGRRRFRDIYEAFADLAWREGWRPKDYIPNDATLRHLEDMRKIVGKKVGIEL